MLAAMSACYCVINSRCSSHSSTSSWVGSYSIEARTSAFCLTNSSAVAANSSSETFSDSQPSSSSDQEVQCEIDCELFYYLLLSMQGVIFNDLFRLMWNNFTNSLIYLTCCDSLAAFLDGPLVLLLSFC